jgi:hypothetical protein
MGGKLSNGIDTGHTLIGLEHISESFTVSTLEPGKVLEVLNHTAEGLISCQIDTPNTGPAFDRPGPTTNTDTGGGQSLGYDVQGIEPELENGLTDKL